MPQDDRFLHLIINDDDDDDYGNDDDDGSDDDDDDDKDGEQLQDKIFQPALLPAAGHQRTVAKTFLALKLFS